MWNILSDVQLLFTFIIFLFCSCYAPSQLLSKYDLLFHLLFYQTCRYVLLKIHIPNDLISLPSSLQRIFSFLRKSWRRFYRCIKHFDCYCRLHTLNDVWLKLITLSLVYPVVSYFWCHQYFSSFIAGEGVLH